MATGDSTDEAALSKGASRFRVLLVDDNATVRQALSLLIESEEDMEVVGEADDGSRAVDMVRLLQPDVVLMDLKMPGMDGIEATRRVMGERPHALVIGLSVHERSDCAGAMFEAGAVDYLLKSDDPKSILASIRKVLT